MCLRQAVARCSHNFLYFYSSRPRGQVVVSKYPPVRKPQLSWQCEMTPTLKK